MTTPRKPPKDGQIAKTVLWNLLKSKKSAQPAWTTPLREDLRGPGGSLKSPAFPGVAKKEAMTPWGSVASDPRRTDLSKPLPADHPFLSGPMKGKQRWQRNLSRSLEGKSADEIKNMGWDIDDAVTSKSNKEFRANQGHMRRLGIPETRPDVWPEPLSPKNETLYQDFKRNNPGLSPRQLNDKIGDVTEKATGARTVVIPAGYNVVSDADRHVRDPARRRNAAAMQGRGSPLKETGPAAKSLVDMLLATERFR